MPIIHFRMRPFFKKRLEDAAVANGRSFSEECEFRLNRSFDIDDIRAVVREELGRERSHEVLDMGARFAALREECVGGDLRGGFVLGCM